jgi:hypothetical protein
LNDRWVGNWLDRIDAGFAGADADNFLDI